MDATMTASSGWWIVREFRHSDGVIYSPGEPLPDTMTEAQFDALSREGTIARVGERPTVPEAAPATAEDYLAATDVVVLRRIRRWRPSKSLLKAVLVGAVETRRPPVLVEALRLALGERLEGPVDAPLRRDPVVRP